MHRFTITFPILLLIVSLCAMSHAAEVSSQKAAVTEIPPAYLLQAGDEVAIRSLQVKELGEKAFRLDPNGEINLPMAGRLRLSGYTVKQSEAVVAEKLKTFYVDPDIAVSLTTLHSDPVSVIGAVGAPGIQQIQRKTTLLDLLSSAGGVRPDAGPVIKVTRLKANGPIPHANVHETPQGDTVADVDLKSLLEAKNPVENIVIMPHDVVSIPIAEVVYVVGNVKRAGGFPLAGKPNLTVLQALAMAEGLDPQASPKRARILRRSNGPDSPRMEIAVDVHRVMVGKAEDPLLLPNDVLFIPSSAAKVISTRGIDAAIQLSTRILIWQ
jgi:polysaccharide export outer membrane protein